MRRTLGLLSIIFLVSLACQAVIPATPTIVPSQTPTNTVTPTLPPPTQTNTPTIIPPILPTSKPSNLFPDFQIQIHPDDGLFQGDFVSLEVIAPPNLDLENTEVVVQIGDTVIGTAGFSTYGIGRRYQATLPWVWDTSGIEAGTHALNFSLQHIGITWTHTITLQAKSQLPWPGENAQWATAESECCLIYYITNTAADRDLQQLLGQADTQADHAAEILNIAFTQPLEVTLMPRVVGQGGFARGDMYVSYLDRNYVGNNFETVLHHEMIHILDGLLSEASQPSILVEGLAVYLTGGHYKTEPLLPRAAALLPPMNTEPGLDWYIPLASLTDDFYNSQHEIGYIQAGALVEFIVNTWGWEVFSEFYWNLQIASEETHSQALDTGLKEYLGITLPQLEEQFLTALTGVTVTDDLFNNVRLTVEIYEAARRYQQILDPSAYFLTAWLPDGYEMRQRGIVADLLRHPSQLENIALETLLVAANQSWQNGDYTRSQNALNAVVSVLDAIELQSNSPFTTHPLAWDHLSIVNILLEAGFHVQQIVVEGKTAQAWVYSNSTDLEIIQFQNIEGKWETVSNQP